MKHLLIFLFLISSVTFSYSQSQDSTLLNRRSKGKPDLSEAQIKKVQEARKHIMQDRTSAHPDSYKAAEELYQKGSKSMGSGDAEKLLSQVVTEYPELNRAGCAQLYLAKMTEGEKQQEMLKIAIDKFHDCWYGDGVQVGPYAWFYML